MACVGSVNARFMTNNLLALTTNSVTATSEKVGFEFTNALNDFRSNIWKPTGHFAITTANQNLYIDDGAPATAVITAASYTTPDLLATEIETQLNAVSSNWTVTYNAVAGTYRFIISNTGSVTLVLSNSTNAIWDTIGFVDTTDSVGTSHTAEEQRNHTSELVNVDFGYRADITFFAMIGDISKRFQLSNAANLTIKGNNILDFTTPPLSLTINPDDKGAFTFLDLENGLSTIDSRYRYWQIEIEDKFNPAGPEGLEVGNIYLGSSTELSRNIKSGFSFRNVDRSTKSESEDGVLFFDKRQQFSAFTNLQFFFTEKEDRDKAMRLFDIVGTSTPFYFSLDPSIKISTKISDFTKFAVFDREMEFPHEKFDNFSINFPIREVI